MKIVINGEPVPQGRPRFTRAGIAYTPDKSKKYRQLLNTAAKLFMLDNKLHPLDYALHVKVSVFRSMPSSWSLKKKEAAMTGVIRPDVKPDLDNYVKAVLDGLNGIVWTDDNLIVQLTAQKYYSALPRVEVEVYPVF